MLGSDETILVVGGGAAGHSSCRAYREAGGEAPVLLLSADDRLPYFRPHVSKEYLAGAVGVEELALAEPDWYSTHDVEVVLGCEVNGLDLGARLASTPAEPVRWRSCVLATGSGPAPLPVPGGDHSDVLTLRSAADTERLLTALSGGEPVALVGSGFIGCEVAASLRRRGHDVTMVSAEARPQDDRLGEPVGRMLERWLLDLGVAVVGGCEVAALEHGDDGVVVRIADHPPVEAAKVVVAVGAAPRLSLATALGLGDDSGVPVGADLRTAADEVFAVGDIANAWHPVARRRLRVEHWGDAEAHGQVAGQALAGHEAAWRSVPGFWSTIGERTIKYVAWGDGHDDVQVRSSATGTTVWYGQAGRVVGVLTHDHDEDNERAEEAVRTGWSFPVG